MASGTVGWNVHYSAVLTVALYVLYCTVPSKKSHRYSKMTYNQAVGKLKMKTLGSHTVLDFVVARPRIILFLHVHGPLSKSAHARRKIAA